MAKKSGDQSPSSTNVNAESKAGAAEQRPPVSVDELSGLGADAQALRAQAARRVKKARRGLVPDTEMIGDAADAAVAQDALSADQENIQLAQATPDAAVADVLLPGGGTAGNGAGAAVIGGGGADAAAAAAADAAAAGAGGGAGAGAGAGAAAAAGADAAAILAAGTGLSTGTLLGAGAGALGLAAAAGGGGGGGGSSAPPSPTVRISTIANDNVVNASEHAAQVTVSGTTTYVEDGRTVSVVLSGHTYTTSVSSGTWSLSVPSSDVAGLAEGSYQVGAAVANGGGLVATDTRSLLVDTTATISIGTVSSDNVINTVEHGAAVVVSGTSAGIEDGRTVTISAGGSSYTATVSGNAWTVNVPSSLVAGLTDGTYTLSASASDAAGNPATNSRAVVVDTTASIAIAQISTDDRVNNTEHGSVVTLSGTTVGVENNNVVTVTLNALTYTATVSGNAWTLSVPTSDVAAMLDGGYQVRASVSDNAGNPASANRMFTVDTSASLSIAAVSTDDVLNAAEHTLALPISGTAAGIEDGRTVTVSLRGQSYTTTVNGGVWTVSVPSSNVAALTDGNYTISASATDAAGNPASGTHAISVDTSATIAINTVSGDQTINATEHGAAVTIQGTTSGIETGRYVTVVLDGVSYQTAVSAGAWTVTVPSSTVAAMAEGSHNITAYVADAAGNLALNTASLTVDTAASITITTVGGDNVVNAAEHLLVLPISGTASGIEDGRTVTVTLNSHSYTATVAGGAWTVTVPTSDVAALTDGNFTISASASDAAGNPASATQALGVDTHATISLNTILGDDVVNTVEHGSAVTISGHTTFVEDGRTVTVLVDTHSYTATVTSGNWTLSVPSGDVVVMSDGSYNVHASVSDLAGNAVAVNGTLVVDTTASIAINAVAIDDVVDSMERQLAPAHQRLGSRYRRRSDRFGRPECDHLYDCCRRWRLVDQRSLGRCRWTGRTRLHHHRHCKRCTG